MDGLVSQSMLIHQSLHVLTFVNLYKYMQSEHITIVPMDGLSNDFGNSRSHVYFIIFDHWHSAKLSKPLELCLEVYGDLFWQKLHSLLQIMVF